MARRLSPSGWHAYQKAMTTPNATWIIDFICLLLVVRHTRGQAAAVKDVLAFALVTPLQA